MVSNINAIEKKIKAISINPVLKIAKGICLINPVSKNSDTTEKPMIKPKITNKMLKNEKRQKACSPSKY